jgi:hypothetical protein
VQLLVAAPGPACPAGWTETLLGRFLRAMIAPPRVRTTEPGGQLRPWGRSPWPWVARRGWSASAPGSGRRRATHGRSRERPPVPTSGRRDRRTANEDLRLIDVSSKSRVVVCATESDSGRGAQTERRGVVRQRIRSWRPWLLEAAAETSLKSVPAVVAAFARRRVCGLFPPSGEGGYHCWNRL